MRRLVLHRVLTLWLAGIVAFLVSCSGNDYTNAIPSSATALVRVGASEQAASRAAGFLHDVLPINDIADCGIDFSADMYIFETADGNFGLCAKVASRSKLNDVLSGMADSGKCSKIRKSGDASVTDVGGSWALCFSDRALLVVGPVTVAAMPDVQRRMTRMLKQDEENSIVGRPMFERLDSMKGSVAMVAQMQALPEKFTAPFALGAPKGTDPSQILVGATIKRDKGVLAIYGETFSFDASVDKSLKDARKAFGKNKGIYTPFIPQSAQLCMYANVDGRKFLPLLQNNKPMQALLVGMNTVIDFDKIIRCTNGDMFFALDGFSSGMKFSMASELADNDWVSDVGYWKQSCSAGAGITGSRSEGWRYAGGDMSFDFGIASAGWFYASSDKGFADSMKSGKKPNGSIPQHLQELIAGSKMAVMLNIPALVGGDAANGSVANMLNAVTGGINTVVYIMK